MEKLGRELARAYMAAYDEAMSKSMLNEEYANQVATIVTMAIASRQPPQPAPMVSKTFEMILEPLGPKPRKKPGQKKDPKKKESGKDEQSGETAAGKGCEEEAGNL